MSLITLTFRNGPIEEYQLGLKGYNFSGSVQTQQIKGNCKIKIIKAVEFFGTDEVCVIGELLEGCIATSMYALLHGKKAEIKEVDSKFGRGSVSKTGTKVILMLSGVKQEDLASLNEIEFIPPAKIQSERPTGKVIIC